MPQEIARQWFVPGDGIDRHVISADIQRYLGNDATVRPGLGTGEHQGVNGYWIKAYRNLTSAMIADLRADSARWRQEQRQTGTREPYVGSSTYHASSASRTSHTNRRDGESPSLDGPYGLPATSSRSSRPPVDTAMQIDPPQPSRGYPQQDTRAPFPADSRPFPSDNRGYPAPPPESRSSYQPDSAMSSGGGFGSSRPPPVSAPYGQEPRYAPSYPQPNDGAPPGYVRQGNYFVPVSSYEPAPTMPVRSDNYGSGSSFGAQPQQSREPRGYPPQEYADPRYAYPSPAATVSSVSAREREPVSSPQSNFGAVPSNQYDSYGSRPPPSAGQPISGSNSNRASGVGIFARPGGSSSLGGSRTGRR